jgi:four helix bundle protein
MTNQIQNPNDKRKFDLEERTACFGKKIIDFARTLSSDVVNKPLISQLIRASTSIGANYLEADGAESKKDFNHKIATCKKEAKETTHWLRMIAKANPDMKESCRRFWKEAHELTLIFSAILRAKKK